MSIDLQDVRLVALHVGTINTSAAQTSDILDTKGQYPYEYATFIIAAPKSTAATNTVTWTSLKLTQGDTTTAFTDVAGFIGSTSTPSTSQFALPAHNVTSAHQAIVWNVDLRGKSRYFQVSAQAPNTTYDDSAITVILSRGGITPNSNAARGTNVGAYVVG